MITGPACFSEVSNITICKLPYQQHFFVHGSMNGKDVWLCQDGTWTIEDGSKKAELPGNDYLENIVKDKRLEELESDIEHAYKCAKEHCPDYPWDDKRPTASQAVWACGSAYEGVSKACEDWRNLFEYLAPDQFKALIEKTATDSKAYDKLLQEIKDKKTRK